MGNEKDIYQKLESLIFDDKFREEIFKLDNQIKNINVFEIIGMEDWEIKHSNFLAWLFENSNKLFNNIFFTEFLLRTIYLTSKQITYAYNYNKDNLTKLKEYVVFAKEKNIEVRREYKNIDILIIDNKNKHIFCIENKIFAEESENQLKKYKDIVDREFSNFENKFYIFLTPDGTRPKKESENYLITSYYEVYEILDNLKKNLSGDINNIIESYIDLLIRQGVVMDKKIEELCNKIWETYGEKLNILMEYKPDLKSIITNILIENEEELINLSSNGRTNFYFYPIILNQKLWEKFGIDKESYTIGFRVFEDKDRKIYWSFIKLEYLNGDNAKLFFNLINNKKLYNQTINTDTKKPDASFSEIIPSNQLIDLNINSNDRKNELSKFIKEIIEFSNEIARNIEKL